MKKIVMRLRKAEHDDEGMALAGVVMLSGFVFIVLSSLMLTSIVSTTLTADNRSALLKVSSAESGVDDALVAATKGECNASKESSEFGYEYEVFRSASDDAPIDVTDPGVTAGCPQDGDKYIVIKSAGSDVRGEPTTIVSTYKWITRVKGSVDGAVTSGGGELKTSEMTTTGENASLVMLTGNFRCEGNSAVKREINGDVIVLNGLAYLTNDCKVLGSIYSSGSVTMDERANVKGNIYTLGDFKIDNLNTVVQGDVYAQGNLTIKDYARINGSVVGLGAGLTDIQANAKILGNLRTAGRTLMNASAVGGNVYSSSKEPADIIHSTINGSLTIGGNFTKLQDSTALGDITATLAGAVSLIANINTTGKIFLGGSLSTWSPGLAALTTQNMVLESPQAPTITIPDQLKPNSFTWLDYNYDHDDWAGYDKLDLINCNFQGNVALQQVINDLKQPTVIDARSCSKLNLELVEFRIQTDITFIANEVNAHSFRVFSGLPKLSHEFNLITPDESKNDSPTCSTGGFDLTSLQMGSEITGFFYTPCSAKIGNNSTINGQIYAGVVNNEGKSAMGINYRKMALPGFPTDEKSENVYYDANAKTRVVPLLVERTEN